MTGYTTPDRIAYPDDVQQPAHSPNALRALADTTQAAVTAAKSKASSDLDAYRISAAANFAQATHTHQYVPQLLPSAYFPTANDNQMTVGVWAVGGLAPGQEAVIDWPIVDGSYIFAQVQHASTWIFVTTDITAPNNVRLRCRNSTTTTTHTNIKVHVLIVNPGA
jgi:hypothetical protein